MKNTKPLSTIPIPSGQQSPGDADRLEDILIKMKLMRQVLTELRELGFHLIPNSRRLKIQSIHRDRPRDQSCIDPSITLCGKWLQKSGFESYEHVYVINFQRLIIICPESPLPEPADAKCEEIQNNKRA